MNEYTRFEISVTSLVKGRTKELMPPPPNSFMFLRRHYEFPVPIDLDLSDRSTLFLLRPSNRRTSRRSSQSQSSPSLSIGISEVGITILNDAFHEKRVACWAGKMEMESVQSIPRLKQCFA